MTINRLHEQTLYKLRKQVYNQVDNPWGFVYQQIWSMIDENIAVNISEMVVTQVSEQTDER